MVNIEFFFVSEMGSLRTPNHRNKKIFLNLYTYFYDKNRRSFIAIYIL